MITTTQLATTFENGLNTILNNPQIQFKIWAEVGKYVKPQREGNTVTHYINGNLRTSTSANDANDLVMGVNGLSLEFSLPVRRPRTNAKQKAEELAEIQNGQYKFVTEMINVINSYFQTARAVSITDETGVEFSVGFQAGTVTPGNVDIAAQLGQNLLISVYVEVYFVAGGVNSKAVKVYFDGKSIPFQAVRHGRSPMTERDVYAGTLVSKSLITSTAFAIDVDFPVTSDPATQECVDYLLSGEPNVAHFVNVQFGTLNEKLYFMTLNTIQTSAQGIAIAGVSASFMEVVDNAPAVGVPEGFQVGRFVFNSSAATTITFTPSADCMAYIAGNALNLVGGQEVTVALPDAAFEQSEEKGDYGVTLITNVAAGVTSSTPFEIVKEAGNGGE